MTDIYRRVQGLPFLVYLYQGPLGNKAPTFNQIWFQPVEPTAGTYSTNIDEHPYKTGQAITNTRRHVWLIERRDRYKAVASQWVYKKPSLVLP